MRKWFSFVFLAFLLWRALIQVFLQLGHFFLSLREGFLGGGLDNYLASPGIWAWANFDGQHYLGIAFRGYGHLQQAFFPLFPWLIKTLASPFSQSQFSYLLSGLTISHISIFISLFILYALVRLDYDEKVARLTTLFLLIFPTSFFFAAFYTESLFLALVLGTFYTARIKKWWLAGILGAFASATRVVGIFLFPAILWEWWEQRKMENGKWKMENLISLIFIFFIPLGLLLYMRSLAINYHDSLMFFHVQPAFGAERSAKLILLYQVFWRYAKMIATTKLDPLYFTVWLELATAITFLCLLVFSYFKKIRLSYLVFAVLAYITPTLTGTFLSMPRFVLVLFPCFISMALIKNRLAKILLFTFYFLLLIVSIIFFTRGYWIA